MACTALSRLPLMQVRSGQNSANVTVALTSGSMKSLPNCFFCEVAFCLLCGDVSKVCLTGLTNVDDYMVNSCEGDERIDMAVLSIQLAIHVLVGDDRDATIGALVGIVAYDEHATPAAGDDNGLIVKQVEDAFVVSGLSGPASKSLVSAFGSASPMTGGIPLPNMSLCGDCALLRKAVLVIPASTVQIVAYKILVDIVDYLDAASIGSRLDAFPCTLTRIVHLVEADARLDGAKLVEDLGHMSAKVVSTAEELGIDRDIEVPEPATLRKIVVHGADVLARRYAEQDTR